MTHNVTVDRVSKELATNNSHAAGDGQRHGPLVEQLEGEVVNGNLGDGQNVNIKQYHCQDIKLPLQCPEQPLWHSW